MEIRFEKPMKVSAEIIMEMVSLSEDQTKLTWTNTGILKYPFNIMIPVMEKHVKKDLDESLFSLKGILEKDGHD